VFLHMQARTVIAPRQSLGSDVMVSVDTEQPSRPESDESISMEMKGGGLDSVYRELMRNCSELSRMRTITAYLQQRAVRPLARVAPRSKPKP
jgi:hypothetical protein